MNRQTLIFLSLVLIIILGTALRFYQLGKIPSGLYIDEAAQGYNAYSLLKTGADEFGKPWPVVFRSFTDFKTPVYIYLITPLIPIFGLTAFTVRFPSFFFSVLTLPLLFALIIRLAGGYKYKIHLALLTTLLLAVSPWHILFGRTDFECNVALFFYLLGVYLFYLGLKKPWVLIFSAIIFAISLPAYHSERIITPLTVLVLSWRHHKQLLTQTSKKYFLIGLSLAFLITLPTLAVVTTPGFLARASGLNIFSHNRQLPPGFIENYQGPVSFLVNGSWFLSTKEFASLYFSYFSPRNMFYLGDYELRSSFPDLATFFVWQFPFYILGLFWLIKQNKLGELRFFTIFLLLAAPIPAAVTRDPYTTIRALPLVIPQVLLLGIGILGVLGVLERKLRIVGWGILSCLVVYSVLQLYSSVIILNEFYRGVEWDYGLEQVALFLQDKYQTIPVVVDNSRKESYIQLAFFLKYDPAKYQQANFEVPVSQYYTNLHRNLEKHIGKIVTRQVNWQQDLLLDQFLVGDELAISYGQIKEHHLTLEKEIRYPDDSVAFRIVKTNPEYERTQPR